MGLDRRNTSHMAAYFYGSEIERGARIRQLKRQEAYV